MRAFPALASRQPTLASPTKTTRQLIDYGEDWNWKNHVKHKHLDRKRREDEEDAGTGADATGDARPKKGFVEGINKKWDSLVEHEHYEMEPDLPTEKAKREGLKEGVARDSSEIVDGEKPYSEYRTNDHHPWDGEEPDDEIDDEVDYDYPDSPEDITRLLPWLDENGVCLSSGKLRVGVSPIRHAGRGLFAAARIREGEAVLTSPLIAMRRDDFTIYKTDDGQRLARNVVDRSEVVGTELLLNYAFAHPDSPLHLVPTAPLANFVNHGGPGGANVRIRWPAEGSNAARLFGWAYGQGRKSHFDDDFEDYPFGAGRNAWLEDHPIDVMERSGKLAFEYVALRDIREGEEVLLDYGEAWDAAWKEFEGRHPYARSGYFRRSVGVPDGLYPQKWLGTGDRYEIAEIKDLESRPLEPGAVVPLTWAHNGRPLGSKYAYAVGLEEGFSDRFLEYSERKGVIELYRRLLTEQDGFHLPSDGFDVYKPETLVNNTTGEEELMEFFAHRYKSNKYRFNSE